MALKEYRHNVSTERTRVLGEIARVWAKIEVDSQPMPMTLDDATAAAALTQFQNAEVDAYDVFLLVAMTVNRVTQIVSDDGDFCTVAGITLFTANPRVIGAARAKGKLIVR